jgi:crossover junction endodeoxyribonuclease RuvC
MARRILGIDPGTQKVGWAVLEESSVGKPSYLASGSWRLGDSRVPLSERLVRLQREVQQVVARFDPHTLALEAAFLGKNVRSALRLGEARGVVIANVCQPGVALLELPPAQVKLRVAGNGNANKAQLARLVAVQLELENDFESEDESDAVAVAFCGVLEQHPSKPGSLKLPPGASLQ